MLQIIVAVLCALFPREGDSLLSLPDTRLDVASADENWWSARVAGAVYRVDADTLLALAWHESRFTTNVVSREPGGRVSCGIATPVPQAHCEPKSLVEQYLAAAEHLRTWIDALGSRALFGYCGGFALNRACARDPKSYRQCDFPGQMARLARRIGQ